MIMWLSCLGLMRMLNFLIYNYEKMKRNLSKHLLPLNACLFLNIFLISKLLHMEMTKSKSPMIQPKLSLVSIQSLQARHNPIHIWITVNMFSWGTVLGKMSLPMHEIQSLTKSKFKIFGLPLSTLLIGRELTILTFSNVILTIMKIISIIITIVMRCMLIVTKRFCFILMMPYLLPVKFWSEKMSLTLSSWCKKKI